MIFSKELLIRYAFLFLSLGFSTQLWAGIDNSATPTHGTLQKIEKRIEEDLKSEKLLGKEYPLSFSDIAKTVFASWVVVAATDQPLFQSIALATSIQLFYYFLWNSSYYKHNSEWLKSKVSSMLDYYQLRQYYVIDRIIYLQPVLCSNPVIFGLTTFILTYFYPAFYIQNAAPTWLDFAKQKFFPSWMTKQYAPLVEKARPYVTPDYNTIKNSAHNVAQKAQSWGSSLLNGASSAWSYATGW